MMFALSFAFACGKEDETDDNKQNQTVEYTVTFVVDGEETVQTVKEGEKATKPADPVKEGYTFVGWYVGDAEYAFDAVTADVTVTAKFELVEDPGDEPGEESEIYYANYTHPMLGEVQFTLEFKGDGTGYYNFMVGGYTGTFVYEENTLSNFVSDFGAAVEVTAIYAEGKYYVTIVFTDVDQTVSVEFAKKGEVEVVTEVYKAYYTHPKLGQVEFTLEFGAEGTGNYNFMAGGYTGTFSYTGTELSNFVKEFGADVEFTYVYSEGVYSATIVFTDADQTVNVEFSKDAKPGVEPEVKEYNVTFVVDGTSEVVTVKEGEKVSKPADPVKEGYNFLGWYAGEDLFNFEAPINADLELVAKFEEATVKPIDPTDFTLVIDGVEYEDGALIELEELREIKLEFRYEPADTLLNEGVDISTSMEDVATVDGDILTTVAPGLTMLEVAGLYCEAFKTYTIKVVEKHYDPESIEISTQWTDAEVGEKFVLSATVSPEKANQEVKWASNNVEVATIDEATGAFVAVGEGKVVISAISVELETVVQTIEITVGPAREVDASKILMIPEVTVREYEYNGVKYYKDRTLFSDFVEAAKAVAEGGVIEFLAGEYYIYDNAILDKTCTVIGPNVDKAVGDERVDEARINVKSADPKGCIVFDAPNVVVNGIAAGADSGIQGVVFLAGANSVNVTIKSCLIYNTNTTLKSFDADGNVIKGKWSITDCHFDGLIQFIAWVKTGDTVDEFEGIDVLNNKFYGEASNVAVNGILSVRVNKDDLKVNVKFNEFDFSGYTWSSFISWVNCGTYAVRYNIFKGLGCNYLVIIWQLKLMYLIIFS